MRLARLLFLAHLAALAFALGGLLIALPHPELWAGSPSAARVFSFGMTYAGSLYIVLGAATMLAFGLATIGPRKTLTFFVLSTSLSLGMELLGTGTGWPFGAYAYTSGLGYKVLGRVPFSIPLSWFTLGFTGYLLASAILGGRGPRRTAAATVALGVWFLTVWDLVLDPAMAHPALPVQFWTWHETGPYFGMPVQNFTGWAMTGALFMALSRVAWRRGVAPPEYPAWLPFGVYAANLAFASALSLSVGLWEPPLVALFIGLLPACLALGRGRGVCSPAWLAVKLGARAVAARRLLVEVEGLEHVPASGPALIVARHEHHLHDGCVLTAALARPVHILVALDWVRSRAARRLMEAACGAVRWPVVLRRDGLAAAAGAGAYRPEEVGPYLRRGVAEAVDLLRAGEVLVVFPEAYPGVDPTYTPKRGATDFLPFRPGFIRLAERVEAGGHAPVPIVPAGLAYEPAGGGRRRARLRFGAPLYVDDWADRAALLRAAEERVRALSAPVPRLEPAPAGEVAQP